MKTIKLWTHKADFSDAELLVDPKTYPELRAGNVVEIYHAEDDFSRLLLQVKQESLAEDLQQKEVISVAVNIAQEFRLRLYKDVIVNCVSSKEVALDMVELAYKEQYFSRADMWRLRQHLVNSCLYLNKKIKFAEMKAQVDVMWSKGDKVACGFVTDDTRITFRSFTSQINIFLQMSSEMWEFDNYGDLYFEKAVCGFLVDLFSQWQEKKCNHDVNITLFSRTFYEANSIDEFPMYMRECVQKDHVGRFYEDFYRVVVQNERYDDWRPTIIQLKKLFIEYPKRVLHYHERKGAHVPRASNSTAAQGNFLEVLNMALNVFEKYYLDRSFDRTGKLSIVITPGVGVFEVDRELTYITKQRTIDCGNGSDLVCMGEQPLHAVPLFKFHNKFPSQRLDVGDDYNIPHWINYSFYTSRTQAEHMRSGKFVPRIKMPHPLPTSTKEEKLMFTSRVKSVYPQSDDHNFPFVDYDDYDAQVFKIPSNGPIQMSKKSNMRATKSSDGVFQNKIPRLRFSSDMYDLIMDREAEHRHKVSAAINISRRRSDSEDYMSNSFGGKSLGQSQSSSVAADEPFPMRAVVGSAGSVLDPIAELSPLTRPRPHRALINPFVPARLHFKVTSNRRRWSHAFPTDLKGAAMQLHHQNITLSNISDDFQLATPTREVIQAAQIVVESKLRKQRSSRSESSDTFGDTRLKSITISSNDSGSLESLKDPSISGGFSHQSNASLLHVDSTSSMASVINTLEMPHSSSSRLRTCSTGMSSGMSPNQHREQDDLARELEGHNWLWGITGDQEWTPEITTGMDWRSMTMPASLPITTDYFPEKGSLQVDYVLADYSLLPEDVNSWNSPVRPPLSTVQVYNEMVAQRVAQGFQLVLLPKKSTPSEVTNLNSSPFQHSFRKRHRTGTPTLTHYEKRFVREEHILSIGRIFHKLALVGNTITVTRYWPRHPYPTKSAHYTYRFQVPDSDSYDVSWTNFCTEKLESYNWNYVDHYICSRGEEEFGLLESLKYWRARYFLLPSNNPATRRISESQTRIPCDIYEERCMIEAQQLIDGFIRFIEIMNKVKRLTTTRKSKSTVPARRTCTSTPGSVFDKDGRSSEGAAKFKEMGKLSEATDSPPPGVTVSPGVALRLEVRKPPLEGNTVSPAVGSLPLTTGDGSPTEALTVTSPLTDFCDAMLDPMESRHTREDNLYIATAPSLLALPHSDGLAFLQKTPGLAELPHRTFSSAEATNWLRANVDGIKSVAEANSILKRMLDERLICHASQNPTHPFVYGFYLYYLVPRQTDDVILGENAPTDTHMHGLIGKDMLWNVESDHMSYPREGSFQYEWCEVAVQEQIEMTTHPAPFLLQEIPRMTEPDLPTEPPTSMWPADSGWMAKSNQIFAASSQSYKVVNVDVDSNQKSDRSEWATARYHAYYSPMSAFELEVQWLVATGSILGDLVQTWGRKAGQSGFHLIPVPGDPFALPFNANSDPLRGPIFVPLDIKCLCDEGQELFAEFDSPTRDERLLLFQDSILKRFGFLLNKPLSASYIDDSRPQYIHCTGGMFVLIPDNRTTSPRNLDGTHQKPVVGSYKDYILWQRAGMDASKEVPRGDDQRTGFLWAWNFMLNKRWRTNITGDERFQDSMLADFRDFCSNADNRLKDFWDSCWAKLLQMDSPESELMEGV